ncbi:MAG TPA: AHH domain-containing protein [Cellvibrionaceae bacterium]|nr:AHH domain-containing protein [Cellvibrionaceae bacterium]
MEVGELVNVVIALNEQDKEEMCPMCPNKKLSACKKKTDPIDTKVVSKPDQLACTPLIPGRATHAYTTAKHHLISAKQCYAKLKRLVRMGSLAKYDINAPANGIPLPTIANDLRFTVGNTHNTNYGALSDAEKKIVAFAVMDGVKAQWHVGHHAVLVPIPAHYADEQDEGQWSRGHDIAYDSEVLQELLKLLDKYPPEAECEADKLNKFKQDMDAISDKIKAKLNQFGAGKPAQSTPFFVSRLAADYANEKSEAPPRVVAPSLI